MPTNQPFTRQLQRRIDELEAANDALADENRRLREKSAWAIMRIRECMNGARMALGEFENDLVLAVPAA